MPALPRQVYYRVDALSAYDEGQAWRVVAQNLSGADQPIYSVAKCLTTEPAGAISLAKRGVMAATALRQHAVDRARPGSAATRTWASS